MAIETRLAALLGYLIPVGLFLLAWGGLPPERARRAATVGLLALALAALGYFTVGFGFHLGGAGVMSDEPGLRGLNRIWSPLDVVQGLGWGMIGLSGFFLAGDAVTPETLVLFLSYLPLVTIAVLIPLLSLSGRAPGGGLVVGGLVMATLVFPLAACWAWGGGWLAHLGETLKLGHGLADWAGAGVVHLLGGAAALGGLVALGDRRPRTVPGEPVEMPPVHLPLLANLGALLFGLGWLGWSLVTPFHATGAEVSLSRIAVNGLLAATGAILVSQLFCWFTTARADALMAARGAAAGWVAISASAPFIPPWGAWLVGAVAGLLLPVAVYMVDQLLRLPDDTAAVGLHTLPALWGLLALPLLADGRWGQGWNGIGAQEYRTVAGQGVSGFWPALGFVGDGPGQLIPQLIAAVVFVLLPLVVMWFPFWAVRLARRFAERRPAPAE